MQYFFSLHLFRTHSSIFSCRSVLHSTIFARSNCCMNYFIMSPVYRKKNGRFVKKGMIEKSLKANAAKQHKKSLESANVKENIVEQSAVVERRIVDVSELGNSLICRNCEEVLSLKNTIHEKRIGLHSILTISCHKCNEINAAQTGKIENNISHTNASVIFGAVHSGVGSTALNEILTCSKIPIIPNDMYERYKSILEDEEVKQSDEQAPHHQER